MENKSNFFAGLAVMAGLVVMGLMLPRAVSEYRSFDRTVSVKGLCERELPADKVIWPIKYKVVGDDLAKVYAEIEQKNAAVTEFLSSGGFDASEISVSVPTVSDKYTQEYGSNDRRYRYVATSTVSVCTANVNAALKLLSRQSELIHSGIAPENEWDGGPKFYFEGLNAVKPEMIQEATQNAREVAQKFAQDSDSRLGKIKSANQGTFSIEDRDSNTPYIKKVRVVTYVDYYLKK